MKSTATCSFLCISKVSLCAKSSPGVWTVTICERLLKFYFWLMALYINSPWFICVSVLVHLEKLLGTSVSVFKHLKIHWQLYNIHICTRMYMKTLWTYFLPICNICDNSPPEKRALPDTSGPSSGWIWLSADPQRIPLWSLHSSAQGFALKIFAHRSA